MKAYCLSFGMIRKKIFVLNNIPSNYNCKVEKATWIMTHKISRLLPYSVPLQPCFAPDLVKKDNVCYLMTRLP